MPIEFDCPQCQNRLRVPDGSEGQTALCPKCSEQMIVPQQNAGTASSNPPSAGDGGNSNPFSNPPADSSESNPYASPTSTTEIPTEGSQASLASSTISVNQVLTETWNGFTENLGAFLLLGVILFGMYMATSIVTIPIIFAAAAAGDPRFMVIAEILGGILNLFLVAFIYAVGLRYTLDVLSGSRSPFERAFKVFPFLLRIVFTNIVVGLLAFAGMLAITLPILPLIFFLQRQEGAVVIVAFLAGLTGYIFIFTRLCLPLLFIIDRGQGVFDSISSSFTYTKGNVWTIFFSILIIGLAGIALFILLPLPGILLSNFIVVAGIALTFVACVLGMIVFLPFITIAFSIIYRLVTGQPARIPRTAPAPTR
ncbi:MAG: hypothetical protein CMJ77_05340 [Planctomycetaceae bacterium]|nr:hypothetical protein [Planctomycetaceae bacterium]